MQKPNGCESQEVSPTQKNEIVVYQPDETLRLDVRLENETVWLTQSQMGTLFGCTTRNVRLHLENIYAGGELAPESTRKDFFLVRREGARRVRRLVKSARKSLLLVDNWATVETLDMLASKRAGVSVLVVTSEHRDRKGNPRPKILPADVAKFNAQYPLLSVRFRESFHDRFLVVDDRELYLIGASLKDLGKKCFAFTKLDASEIAGLKARM